MRRAFPAIVTMALLSLALPLPTSEMRTMPSPVVMGREMAPPLRSRAIAAEVAARPSPSPAPESPVPTPGQARRGVASWYSIGPGLYAAAGPALRVGPWRGRVVRVCRLSTCIETRLSDWCQCYDGTKSERVIDLSYDAFARLAPGGPAQGLVEVTVTW